MSEKINIKNTGRGKQGKEEYSLRLEENPALTLRLNQS